MRVFVIAAMGAAVLAGCAPFEHGHYAEDVAFVNSVGDPRGTPLVYQDTPIQSTQFAPTHVASAPSTTVWPQHASTVASNSFGAGGFPVQVARQPVQFSQPAPYLAPAPQIARASVVAPVVSTPISYTPAVQQTYVPPVQTRYVPTVKSVPAPIVQTVVRPSVTQIVRPQPIQQTVQRASYVGPRQPTSKVLATTHGGHQVDADGYAICNIPLPNHVANQTPQFRPAYKPASHLQRSIPQPLLRF